MPANRLLLIEDDFDVAEMLLMYFRETGFEVLHADRGEDGIEIARKQFPDLILLDVMLPDMDGYDVCVELRKRALTRYIPTLFLTQRDERSDKVRGLTLGADDYITKPFDIDELRLRIEGAIRRASRENLHEARTGLPSGELVEEELRRRTAEGHEEIRLVLDGFAAYTEVYSFMAANDAMYHAARIIRDVVSESGAKDDFVGMIKDEFVITTAAGNIAALLTQIQTRFDEIARTLYNFIDADRGGVLLYEGQSNERLVPLMRLVRSTDAPAS